MQKALTQNGTVLGKAKHAKYECRYNRCITVRVRWAGRAIGCSPRPIFHYIKNDEEINRGKGRGRKEERKKLGRREREKHRCTNNMAYHEFIHSLYLCLSVSPPPSLSLFSFFFYRKIIKFFFLFGKKDRKIKIHQSICFPLSRTS